MDDIRDWFLGRLPDDWFTEAPSLAIDRDEILLVGHLREPAADGPVGPIAYDGRIKRFREETRRERMAISYQAEELFGRRVSWGARCGTMTTLFTHVATEVTVQLGQAERQVLDRLVEEGRAATRPEALLWCVRRASDASSPAPG